MQSIAITGSHKACCNEAPSLAAFAGRYGNDLLHTCDAGYTHAQELLWQWQCAASEHFKPRPCRPLLHRLSRLQSIVTCCCAGCRPGKPSVQMALLRTAERIMGEEVSGGDVKLPHKCQLRMLLFKYQIGAVMGKKGATINEIRNKSAASVKLLTPQGGVPIVPCAELDDELITVGQAAASLQAPHVFCAPKAQLLMSTTPDMLAHMYYGSPPVCGVTQQPHIMESIRMPLRCTMSHASCKVSARCSSSLSNQKEWEWSCAHPVVVVCFALPLLCSPSVSAAGFVICTTLTRADHWHP